MAKLFNEDMKTTEKKVTWSKLIVVITSLIFILTLITTLYLFMSGRVETISDVSVLGICVTVTGSIFGSNLCWYSKKATAENHYKLRMNLYSDSAKIRYEYNVEMFKAMKKLGITQEDLERIESDSDCDDMMSSALTSVTDKLDIDQEDASSEDTIESFNG